MGLYEKYSEILDSENLISGDFNLSHELTKILPDLESVEVIMSVAKNTYSELCVMTVEDLKKLNKEFDYSDLYFPRYKIMQIPEEEGTGYLIFVLTEFGTYMVITLMKKVE